MPISSYSGVTLRYNTSLGCVLSPVFPLVIAGAFLKHLWTFILSCAWVGLGCM